VTTEPATPRQRIVSLLPSATEIVYALGLGERSAAGSDLGRNRRHVRKSPYQGSSLHVLDADLLERSAPR
jgi:ABC-type Fe3+-hydroxamate transport system substrate-binding protein